MILKVLLLALLGIGVLGALAFIFMLYEARETGY